MESPETVRIYEVTGLTRLMSSLWVLAASESLHGWPARRIPLSSTLLATSVLGLEPYVGSVSNDSGELRVETVSDRVVVVGSSLGGVVAANELRRAGIRVLVISNGVRDVYGLLGLGEEGEYLKQLAGIEPVDGYYVGLYDEGHAFVASDTLYVTRGPVVYAAGAEQPPPIALNNDLPGIVSANYGAEIVAELGYRPRRVVVLGYGYLAPRVADWLASRGVETRLVALKGAVPEKPEKAELVETRGVKGFAGENRVEAVVLEDGERLEADMVVSALGIYPDSPPVYAAGYPPIYVGDCYRFVPELPGPGTDIAERGYLVAAGMAIGYEWLDAVIASARYAAALVAYSMKRIGEGDVEHFYSELREALGKRAKYCPRVSRPPIWLSGEISGLQFIDLDEDLVLYHVYSAWSKGYRTMETLKRATGLGTGSDQGRFSAASSAIILSAISGIDASEIGLFRPRPPYFAPEASLLARAPTEW